jgi:2-iminobutanoate/2-iminopropanoate deaminase
MDSKNFPVIISNLQYLLYIGIYDFMAGIKKVVSENAPKAIGPYSQAVVHGNHVYCAGLLGMSPQTMDFASEDVLDQARQTFKNMQEILEAAGSSLNKVIKVEIFVTDMNDFAVLNQLYGEVFVWDPAPARQTFEVSALPRWAKVMMSCIAYVEE